MGCTDKCEKSFVMESSNLASEMIRLSINTLKRDKVRIQIYILWIILYIY